MFKVEGFIEEVTVWQILKKKNTDVKICVQWGREEVVYSVEQRSGIIPTCLFNIVTGYITDYTGEIAFNNGL
jgi:hypothetical protein